MVWDTAATVFAGTLFGASLAVSGVWLPEVIIGQFQLQDFHMAKAFLVGSAISAIVLLLYERNGLLACKPKGPASLGWFHRYDGNILGGLLQGMSMALVGACPGTLLPQVVIGHPSSARFVLLGGILGGVLYAGVSRWLHPAPFRLPVSPITYDRNGFMPFLNEKEKATNEATTFQNGDLKEQGRNEHRNKIPASPILPILPEDLCLLDPNATFTIRSVLDPIICTCDDLPSPSLSSGSVTPTEALSTPPLTIPALLHADSDLCRLAYIILTAIMLLMLAIFTPPTEQQSRVRPNPYIGGLAIGVSQLVTIVLIRLPVGMSLAYEEAGGWVWYLIQGAAIPPRWKALTFTGGMAVGSALCVPWVRAMGEPGMGGISDVGASHASKTAQVLQGLLLVFGARMAGGCPSGHGLSGLALLWTSSLVTIAAIIVGGFGTAAVMKVIWGLEGRGALV